MTDKSKKKWLAGMVSTASSGGASTSGEEMFTVEDLKAALREPAKPEPVFITPQQHARLKMFLKIRETQPEQHEALGGKPTAVIDMGIDVWSRTTQEAALGGRPTVVTCSFERVDLCILPDDELGREIAAGLRVGGRGLK